MKTKRKMTDQQQKALQRNWHKGMITSSIKHFNDMKGSDRLTLKEKMAILRCKTTLEDLLSNWKPTI